MKYTMPKQTPYRQPSKLESFVNENYDIDEVYFEVFGKHIPSGKVFCPNPLHDNHNTPAAKRYQNAIHCFVCQRSFTPYHLLKWYRPDLLEKINSTQVLPSPTAEPPHERIIIHNPDEFKNMSISQILSLL